MVGAGEQRDDFPANGVELLWRAHAIRPCLGHSRLYLPHQSSDPDHKELVQIGTHYGKEEHPFQQRVRVVLRLLQDSRLEGKQAQLPIYEQTEGSFRSAGSDEGMTIEELTAPLWVLGAI